MSLRPKDYEAQDNDKWNVMWRKYGTKMRDEIRDEFRAEDSPIKQVQGGRF